MAAFLQRRLAQVARIEPHETKAVVAAFLLFFFLLGSYFLVRPVRETVATILGGKAVAGLWLYTATFSIAIVPVYGWLVARIPRTILLPCLYGSVAIILAMLGLLTGPATLDRRVGAFFYVWISVLNLLLVSAFWSVLLELFTSEQAKRLFGFIAAGGTIGALAGPLIASLFAGRLGMSGILYLAAAGFACAIGCQIVLLSVQRPTGARDAGRSGGTLGGNPLSGVARVLRSPYLLGIAVFVCLLSAANTVLYFEQLRIVGARFADPTRRTEIFADIDFVVQSLTVLSQLFLTGWIARWFGVRALLLILPVAMVAGFLTLALAPAFAVLLVVFVIRRWGEYAFSRPGREMLFSTLDTETKYKAKNVIDVPVYRFSDYVGAQAKTAIDALTASPTASVLAGAGLSALWVANAWWLGTRHDARVAEEARALARLPGGL